MNKKVYIVDGTRTPFCKMGTTLASEDPVSLGTAAVKALLSKYSFERDIFDEVIFGCVSQPADAANIARVIALRSGIPETIPAYTVHRNCASGFESITQACDKIASGQGDLYLVGGTESMSNVPFIYSDSAVKKFNLLARAKTTAKKLKLMSDFRPSDFQPRIGLQMGLTDPVCGLNMGETAEVLSRDFGISREEQDLFALHSHEKANAAHEKLMEEITTFFPKKGFVESDNGPREGQSIEALQKLQPVFERRTGTVTAGNASQITDGAAALIIASEEAVIQHGFTPIGEISGYAFAGCSPERMGIGPVHAIDKLEQKTGLSLAQADIVEVNEAFAAQVLAVQKAVNSTEYCKKHFNRESAIGEIPDEILNVNGGSIALGHPVGATGSRLVLTSLHELKRRNAKNALVSLCIGGGQGGAIWLNAA